MYTFRAPARIPLYLRVVGVNDDGSPKMIALNQTIDLCDHLKIQRADQDQIPLGYPKIRKAVDAYREYTGKNFAVSIELASNFPCHIDIGLKYSHAATTLWGLNKLSEQPLEEEVLKKVAKTIHPDVLFFFSQGTATCCSGGDIKDELPPKQKSFWLVCPPYSLSSDKIMKRFSIADLQDPSLEHTLDHLISVKAKYCNDLEESAFALDPKLALRKQRMKGLGFDTVVMAGTDSALYCMDGPSHQLTQDESYQTQYINRSVGSWY